MARNAAAASIPVRQPLTRERIVAAALALIDRDGLAAFSIRGLGAALGCEPMSIYHYFPSKGHLQDALVDDALASVLTDPPGADPLDRLRAVARSYRALAHRHPKLFPLIAVHRLNTPTGVRVIEEVLKLVHAAVADDRLAAQYFRVLGYYITGAALDETAGYANGPSAMEPVSEAYIAENCPRLATAARYHRPEEWEGTFELGLESLLGAMRAASSAVDTPDSATTPKPVIRPKR
jgi:AcrR family transcriptional regulator